MFEFFVCLIILCLCAKILGAIHDFFFGWIK